MHHRMKADAPSGTALALGEAAARGRGRTLEQAERGRDRHRPQARETARSASPRFAAARSPGDHDVIFAGPDERLILSHRAESRAIFARGALAAARFLYGKPAGLYTMRDVIELAVKKAEVFEFFRRLAEANPAPETELEYREPLHLAGRGRAVGAGDRRRRQHRHARAVPRSPTRRSRWSRSARRR